MENEKYRGIFFVSYKAKKTASEKTKNSCAVQQENWNFHSVNAGLMEFNPRVELIFAHFQNQRSWALAVVFNFLKNDIFHFLSS